MPEIRTISRFAFKEAVRKKVLAGALILALAYVLLYSYGLSNVLQINLPSQMIMVQFFSMALFGGGFMMALLAVLIAAGAVSGELETGTIYAVLTKPITKKQFILGKFFGYALMLTIFTAVFFLGLWLVTLLIGGIRLPGVLPALGLFILQPLVMLSVTFFGSVLLSTMATGVVMFMLYGVGFIGGMIEQIGTFIKNDALINLGIISSLLLPVDALYRRAVHILTSSIAEGPLGAVQGMGPFGSLSVPSNWMVLYAVIYILSLLLLSLKFFSSKDI